MRRASHLCTLGLFFALAHTTLSAQHATFPAPERPERLVANSGPLELESIGDVRPPQILPPVPLANDPDALLFEWSKSEPATGMDLEYEFCLYLTEGASLSGSPVFRHAIRTNRLVYDSRFPLLLPEADYVAVVNLRLSNEREAQVVDGTSGAVVFHNIPRCTDPRNFRIASTGRNKVTLNWEGRAAEPRGVRYLVQYRTKNGRGDWQEILVEQGLSVSINGITARQAFEFRIRKLCDGTGKNAEFASDWVGLQANAERIQLPPFTCGAQYTPPACNIDPNDCPWQQVEIGDTLYIGGFPIQLDSVEVDSTLDANNDLVPYYSKMFGLIPLSSSPSGQPIKSGDDSPSSLTLKKIGHAKK